MSIDQLLDENNSRTELSEDIHLLTDCQENGFVPVYTCIEQAQSTNHKFSFIFAPFFIRHKAACREILLKRTMWESVSIWAELLQYTIAIARDMCAEGLSTFIIAIWIIGCKERASCLDQDRPREISTRRRIITCTADMCRE